MSDSPITYIPPSGHGHEGSHRITVAGREILVQGEGRTTTKKRFHVAQKAYQAAREAGALDQIGAEAVVGALVLAGATNITVDGEPIHEPERGRLATIVVDVASAGDAGPIAISLRAIDGGNA